MLSHKAAGARPALGTRSDRSRGCRRRDGRRRPSRDHVSGSLSDRHPLLMPTVSKADGGVTRLRTEGKTRTWRLPGRSSRFAPTRSKWYSQRYSGAFEPGEYHRRARAAPLCRRNGPQSRSSGVPFAPQTERFRSGDDAPLGPPRFPRRAARHSWRHRAPFRIATTRASPSLVRRLGCGTSKLAL